MDRFTSMQAFVTVAATGGFTAAALALDLPVRVLTGWKGGSLAHTILHPGRRHLPMRVQVVGDRAVKRLSSASRR